MKVFCAKCNEEMVFERQDFTRSLTPVDVYKCKGCGTLDVKRVSDNEEKRRLSENVGKI